MAEVNLSATLRAEQGKGPAKRLRAQGLIPGILYGHSEKPILLTLNPRELYKAVKSEAGLNAIINLTINGGTSPVKHTVLVKDFQVDSIKRVYVHVDLLQVRADEEVKVEIPVILIGKAKGVTEGGIIQQNRRELEVYCKAGNIPKAIEVDISHLEIADSLHVNDLKLPPGVRIVVHTNFTIAACVPPEAEIVETPVVAAPVEGEAAAAPAEGEAPAEGAAPAKEGAPKEAAKPGKEKSDKK